MHDNDDIVDAWHTLAARVRHHRDAEAEDYLQDAVVAALDERRRTGRVPSAAGAWLRTVARRREVDHVRRAQCERRVVAVTCADDVDDVAHEVVDRHEARWLARHVEQLPPTTRDVVRALATGQTQGEVADELDLTPRAVEAHVRRARIALRRVLERAGVLAGLLLGGRRWRRVVPVTAAGVAAAVGIAMIGTPDSFLLVPLPPKPRVLPTPDPDRPGPDRFVTAGGATGTGTGPASVALPPRSQVVTDPPVTSPPSSPVPSAEPDPVGTQVVLVNPKGTAADTTFATSPGVWYEITVAGTYSYNGRDGLADCGHWIPEGDTEWQGYQALFVDGEPAACWSMPYDPLHVYRWHILGTGKQIRFHVQDQGGSIDNVGQLAITMSRVSRTS